MLRRHAPRSRASRIGRWSAAIVAGAALTACSPGPGAFDPAECGRTRLLGRTDVVALTSDGKLACLDVTKLDRSKLIGSVTGLQGSETLVGIDYRSPFTTPAGASNGVPVGGTLYGLGNAGGVYSINAKTAVATKKAQLDVALAGTHFAIDFNPTVDRLRIVSDTGQNLRANVDTGATLVDGPLNVGGASATGIVAIAYTNVDSDSATATTLYDIDAATDALLVQTPPNDGTLATTGGSLGVDVSGSVGFDFATTVKATSSAPGAPLTTTDLAGYVTASPGGVPTVYELTPFSGRLRSLGALPFGLPAIDIAAPLAQ